MQKSKRIVTAQDSLKIVEQGYYINAKKEQVSVKKEVENCIKNTILYEPDAFENLFEKRDKILLDNVLHNTIFEVHNKTVNEVLEDVSKTEQSIFCLNFASAKNPGGGFLGGAQAQEESLSRSSALYPSLLTQRKMYDFHRQLKTCLYSDHMIYSPNVPFFKNDEGENLDLFYTASILTSPAVNVGVIKRQEPQNITKIDTFMEARLEKILSIAILKGHEVLILGAWGCGVFRNEAKDVAGYFQKALLENPVFKNRFRKVIFAVYDRSASQENFNCFKNILNPNNN